MTNILKYTMTNRGNRDSGTNVKSQSFSTDKINSHYVLTIYFMIIE